MWGRVSLYVDVYTLAHVHMLVNITRYCAIFMSLNKYVFFLVDLVALSSLVEMFREQELQQADHVMDVVEVIHGLTALYEKLEEERSVLVNIPLCVDMCLNWLLNVYDR